MILTNKEVLLIINALKTQRNMMLNISKSICAIEIASINEIINKLRDCQH